MFLGSDDPWFPALLMSDDLDGEPLPEGKATISQTERTVTFTSDFVPLYPVGTPMRVVRTHEGKPVHDFVGRVYLSDKKLMRLVDVDDKPMEGSEEVYCRSIPCAGTLTLRLPDGLLGALRRRFGDRKKLEPFPVTVDALTSRQMEFQLPMDRMLAEGSRFLFTHESGVPLPPVTVEVTKALYFGEQAGYLCDFKDLPPRAEDILKQYLAEYSCRNNKLF